MHLTAALSGVWEGGILMGLTLPQLVFTAWSWLWPTPVWYRWLLRAHSVSHLSLSLCLSPTPHLSPLSLSLSPPQCISFCLWACVSISPTCSRVSVPLSVPLGLSVALLLSSHLSVWVSLYVGASLSLQVYLGPPPCPSFPSCLLPSFSLTWATPPAAWGLTQPSHSAHIFNSHLLSLLLPFLAVGHSKQNVRKQKLMSFFKRG